MRAATETLAVAVTIHHDPKKMALFIQHKFPDDTFYQPKARGPADQYLPGIKELYEHLSNEWSHETYATTTRLIDEARSTISLVPAPDATKARMNINQLLFVATVAYWIGLAGEICFPRIGNEVHWASEGAERARRHDSMTEKAIFSLRKALGFAT